MVKEIELEGFVPNVTAKVRSLCLSHIWHRHRRCSHHKRQASDWWCAPLQQYFDIIYSSETAGKLFHAKVNNDPNARLGPWVEGVRKTDFSLPVNVPAMMKKLIGAQTQADAGSGRACLCRRETRCWPCLQSHA